VGLPGLSEDDEAVIDQHQREGDQTDRALLARCPDSTVARLHQRASTASISVTNAGTFRLKDHLLFIANALKQNLIGLEEIDDGIWSIYLCNVLLAHFDEHDFIIRG